MTDHIPTLDLRTVQATVGRDDDDRPTIVITDGTAQVVLGGGEDRDIQAGARRIVEGIWDYQLLVAARREAAYRAEHLAEGICEASDAYSPASEARIVELRGSGPSVSGAY